MEFEGLVAEINGGTVETCLSSFLDDGTADSHRYFLARRTALEMLRDRGFTVPSSEIDLSLQQFRAIYGPIPDPDRLQIVSSLQSDTRKKMMVMFYGPAVVKLSAIRNIASVNKDGLIGLILVLQNKITSQASKALDLLPFKVEMFQITDLLVNITKHVLKPKHLVLTEKEKHELLKQFSLEETQLPRMSHKDPIARYYGLEKGQVVKISYSGVTTQSHVAYRRVW